jgi:hypothetical protein
MIRRIVLDNYMSHANSVIEPAPDGLTVLVGPNNCGKSAVVSALLTVCGENDGDFMVRHGEKHARVTIETAEGDTIVWQRKRTPSYVINGREVHRVGRGNLPDDLQALLKLPAIEFGEGSGRSRFVVHFGLQKEPIFLINSESDVAKFFSSSAEAERLLAMQQLHKKKTADARGELRAVEADLTDAAARLASLMPLDAIAPEVEAVEARYAALVGGERSADELAGRIARIELMRSSVAQQQARVDGLADLHAAPALDYPEPLDRMLTRFAKTANDMNAIEARRVATEPLREPPAQDDPGPITQLGLALSRAQRSLDLAIAASFAYEQLRDVPAVVETAPLEQSVDRCTAAAKHAAGAERALATVSRELESVRGDIVAWVTQNPTCPVCGNPTECGHVIEAGGPHAN